MLKISWLFLDMSFAINAATKKLRRSRLIHFQCFAAPTKSLPLNRRRWLGGDVVDYAVDFLYLVGDAVGYCFQ